MKQAVMIRPGKIEFADIERPRLTADEVILQIKRIGVCGSDIHVFHGLHPYTSYPVVQGHEIGAVIAETGANVKGFEPGDKVVFMPQVTCGQCYPCRHGMYHICDNLKVMGFQTDGAAQEFFAIKADMVLKLPEAMTLDEAALIEPVSVATHAISRAGSVEGLNVVVLGAGTIGNLVAQVARASGARGVILTDVSEYKLEKARACGFEHVVNPQKDDLGQAILNAFVLDKADLILECVGAQDTITQAVSNARKGSTIIVVGVFGKKPLVDLGLVQDRELSLIGTLMYQRKDYVRAIELAGTGKLCLDQMVTHRFAFKDYLKAYEAIEASGGNYMKVMIDL
ncbi:MAG: alcohol dehydrogenase catalytic domain-containing protein [Anaerolineales bacterium]|jgi:L-iditol 2-dehydrogenase